MYNFGLYHWRKWLRLILRGAVGFAVAAIVWRETENRAIRVIATITGVISVAYASEIASKMLRPPPWQADGERVETLAEHVSFDPDARVLDVGCGTGRSLVGLAPHIPLSCSVTGLDSFETGIILGNTPTRALSNVRKAGLDPSIVVGDATELPFSDDSHDVVIVSQVLHDLPAREAEHILAEISRICTSDGTLGLIELPLVNDETEVDAEYWLEVVEDAGFTVESVEYYPWIENKRYAVLTATPTQG